MQYEDFVTHQISRDICACINTVAPLDGPAQNSTVDFDKRTYRVEPKTLVEERTDAARPCLRSCELSSPFSPVASTASDDDVCVAKTDEHAEIVEYTARFRGLSLKANLLRFVNQSLRDDLVKSDAVPGGVSGRTDMTEEEEAELAGELEKIEMLEEREAVMADETEETEFYPATYFVTVQAVNPTGRLVAQSTQGIKIDITAPIFFDRSRPECVDPFANEVKNSKPCGKDPMQYDVGWLNDQGEQAKLETQFQGNNHTLAVTFKAVDYESPISSYMITILEGNRTLVDLQDVGRVQDWNVTGLELQQGVKYCIIVRAVNAAGLWTDAPGQCITVDMLPPELGDVWSTMETGQNIAKGFLPERISRVVYTDELEPRVNYAIGGFGGPAKTRRSLTQRTRTSGIDRVELAVGTRPGGCETIDFFFASAGQSVDVAIEADAVSIERKDGAKPDGFVPVTEFVLSSLLLSDSDIRFKTQPGQTYYFNAKAISRAHLNAVAVGPALAVLGPAARSGTVLSGNASKFDFSVDMGEPASILSCTNVSASTTPPFAGCLDYVGFEGLDHAWGWSTVLTTTTTTDTTTTETSTTSTTTLPCIDQMPLLLVCKNVTVNVTNVVLARHSQTDPNFAAHVATVGRGMVDDNNCTCIGDRISLAQAEWPVKTPKPGSSRGRGMTMGMLTHEDVTEDYRQIADSTCAGLSEPYIHSPFDHGNSMLSRRLVGRIYGYQNVSFYASPLGHKPLEGPITLAIDFDPNVYANGLKNAAKDAGLSAATIVPIVAYWNQKHGEWHDVESTCPQYINDLGPKSSEGKIRLEVCETNPVDFAAVSTGGEKCKCVKFCAGNVCEQKCQINKDANGPTLPVCPEAPNNPNLRFLTAETHFALFWGNAELVNTPPETEDVSIEGDEDTIQQLQLNYTDAESDVVKFDFEVSSEVQIPGHLTVTQDGLLTFKPAPYFNGKVKVTYTVTESIFAKGMSPFKSKPSAIEITIRPQRSPPILLFVSKSGNSPDGRKRRSFKHGQVADVQDYYTDVDVALDASIPSTAVGDATEGPWEFTVILIDVDSPEAQKDLSITTYFDESNSGNVSHVLQNGLTWTDKAGFPSDFDAADFMFGQRDSICNGSTPADLEACGYPWGVLDRDYGIYNQNQWASTMRTHTFYGSKPGVFEYSLLGWNAGDNLYSEEALSFFFVACGIDAFKPASNALACTNFNFCDEETTFVTTNGSFYADFVCSAVTDCDNGTHYTLVRPTFYTDAICAPYTTSTTTQSTTTQSTTTTNTTIFSNVTEIAAAEEKNNTVAILVPILVILLLVSLVVGGKVHEKNEGQWGVDMDIAETNLLFAMGSAWEVDDKDLKNMGDAFIKQLPMCKVCGQRGLQAVVDSGSCCIFEMGINSVDGDCVDYMPQMLSKVAFTNRDIHQRMTRADATSILRRYGVEPGEFFLCHIAVGGKRRAHQLSVQMWAVGTIDENAGPDDKGQNNTWVRSCNIIQHVGDAGTFFKVDGQRVEADTWNSFFALLAADDDGRIFDACPTRFIPVGASKHFGQERHEGEQFGEVQTKDTAPVEIAATAEEIEASAEKRRFSQLRGGLTTAVAATKSRGNVGKNKKAPANAFWSFERETGYTTTSGTYFTPSKDELPNPDWPLRQDGRPPRFRRIRTAPIEDAAAAAKSQTIAETSFPTAVAPVAAMADKHREKATQETSFNDPPLVDPSTTLPGFGGNLDPGLAEEVTGFGDLLEEDVGGFGDLYADSDGNSSDDNSLKGFGGAEEFESDDNSPDGGYTDVKAIPERKHGRSAGVGSKAATSSMMLLVAVALTVMTSTANALTLKTSSIRPPNVIGSDLEEAASKLAFLNHKRFGNKFERMHAHFDTDNNGYLSAQELVPAFVSARIGSDPTRTSWAASFVQSFARSISHGISQKDFVHCYERIGFVGTGAKCDRNVEEASFCPKLPADIADKYLYVFEEEEQVYGAGEAADCAECSQAGAMDSVRWPRLPFVEKQIDKYALHSIFDEIEAGCDIVAFEECLLADNSTCTDCSAAFQCPFREALFRVAGGHFTGPSILAAPHFLAGLQAMDAYASECNVLLNVQSSLQYTIEASATPASVHAEAVRFHVEDGAGLCDKSCMKNSKLRRPAVSCFLDLVEKDSLITWAGHNLNITALTATASADDAVDLNDLLLDYDATMFEAYPDCRNEELNDLGGIHPNCTVRAASAMDELVTSRDDRANLLSLFHDFKCARPVSIGPARQLQVETVRIDHSKCMPDSTFDETTDSVAVFPSGLRATIKTWSLRPFGIAEYASPFGNDETAPLIDGKLYADTAVSKSLKLADFMSGAICSSDLQVAVALKGKSTVRNRMLRLSPTLVKGLERLVSNTYQAVEIIRGYQTNSEAVARGETNLWYQTGAAARVAFSETNARIRNIDLAAEAIRSFYPVVREAGMALGIGLHVDGVHVDIRPPSVTSRSSIHAWAAGGADLTSAEFKAWAELEFARVPLMTPMIENADNSDACRSAPSDLPWKQHQLFGGKAVSTPSPSNGGGEWCGKVRSALSQHFDEVWALVTTRYAALQMTSRRSLAEVEQALRSCLDSCDGESLEAPAPGSVAAIKIKACNQALHWLPFSIASTRGTCSLAVAGSPLKSTACFWGVCEEATELYGLLGPKSTFQPVLPVSLPSDPKCGADELMYGSSNPSPLTSQLRSLYAGHCSGRVMVFIASTKELMIVEAALKVLIVYNPDVVFVDIRVSATAYDDVVGAMDGLVKSWKPTICQMYTERQFLAPYTMVKVGSNEIKSAVPVAV